MAEEARVRVRANRRTAMDEAKKLRKPAAADRRRLARSRERCSKTDRSFREIGRRTPRAQRSRGDEGLDVAAYALRMQRSSETPTLALPTQESSGAVTLDLQPHQVQQELAPEINHPAPGIFDFAAAGRFQHALLDVVRDLVAQIVLDLRPGSASSSIGIDHTRLHLVAGAEIHGGFGKAARTIGRAAAD